MPEDQEGNECDAKRDAGSKEDAGACQGHYGFRERSRVIENRRSTGKSVGSCHGVPPHLRSYALSPRLVDPARRVRFARTTEATWSPWNRSITRRSFRTVSPRRRIDADVVFHRFQP